jgi:hypothetical protein
MFYQPLPFYEKEIFQNNNRHWVGEEDYSYILPMNRWEFVPFIVEKTDANPIGGVTLLISKQTGAKLSIGGLFTWNYEGNFAKPVSYSIDPNTPYAIYPTSGLIVNKTVAEFISENGEYYYLYFSGSNVKKPFSEIFRFSKHNLYTVEPTKCNQIRIDTVMTKDVYGIPVENWGGVTFRSWFATEVVRPKFEYLEEVEEDNVGDATIIYKKLIERRSFQIVVDEQTAGYLNSLPLYNSVSIFDQLGRIYQNPKKWNIATDWIDENSAWATVTIEFWVDSQAIGGC